MNVHFEHEAVLNVNQRRLCGKDHMALNKNLIVGVSYHLIHCMLTLGAFREFLVNSGDRMRTGTVPGTWPSEVSLTA